MGKRQRMRSVFNLLTEKKQVNVGKSHCMHHFQCATKNCPSKIILTGAYRYNAANFQKCHLNSQFLGTTLKP
jgi:hypothetical protein